MRLPRPIRRALYKIGLTPSMWEVRITDTEGGPLIGAEIVMARNEKGAIAKAMSRVLQQLSRNPLDARQPHVAMVQSRRLGPWYIE